MLEGKIGGEMWYWEAWIESGDSDGTVILEMQKLMSIEKREKR